MRKQEAICAGLRPLQPLRLKPPLAPQRVNMAGTTELIYMGNLNKAGYEPVEVYVNVGYEP